MIPLHNIDYFVRFVALPCTIGGCTVPNDDGTYDVYINPNVCQAKQKHAFYHELSHIYLEHFSRDLREQIMELEAEHFAPYMETLVRDLDPEVADICLN